VHHGEDHFFGAPELSHYVALFLRKIAQYRLPKTLPSGDEPVQCLPLKAEDGWLADGDFYNSVQSAPAAYADYKGDKAKAFWHYDREVAEANAAWHSKLGRHQVLDSPKGQWLDEGDGWTFRLTGAWLEAWPDKYGGPLAGKPVGHASTPFVFRCPAGQPFVRTGPDTFRLLRTFVSKKPAIHFSAFHPGDDQYRSTARWGSIDVPVVKGEKQTIEFAAVPDLKTGAEPYALQAKASSGLPVYYEVDFGPATVRDGKLVLTDVPVNAPFPLDCRVTAYQIGRRVAPLLESAPPVSREFKVVKP